MVFKKGGKLRAHEGWKMHEQNTEVVQEFNYLGVTLESRGGWNKQKTLDKTTGRQALVAVDKCIRNPQYKGTDVRDVYKMECESKITYGIEGWGLSEARKELDTVHSRFCKKLMGILNCAAK
jgi:hypothetical protein